MEVDAVILLVLSIAAATVLGWWAVLIGAMRYLYHALSTACRRARDTGAAEPLPRHRSRAAGCRADRRPDAGRPESVGAVVILVALALLSPSFVHQAFAAFDVAHPPSGRLRRTLGVVVTVLAGGGRLVRAWWRRTARPWSPPPPSSVSRSRAWSLAAVATALPTAWRRVAAVTVRAAARDPGDRQGPRPRLPLGVRPALRPAERLVLPRPGDRRPRRLDRCTGPRAVAVVAVIRSLWPCSCCSRSACCA